MFSIKYNVPLESLERTLTQTAEITRRLIDMVFFLQLAAKMLRHFEEKRTLSSYKITPGQTKQP